MQQLDNARTKVLTVVIMIQTDTSGSVNIAELGMQYIQCVQQYVLLDLLDFMGFLLILPLKSCKCGAHWGFLAIQEDKNRIAQNIEKTKVQEYTFECRESIRTRSGCPITFPTDIMRSIYSFVVWKKKFHTNFKLLKY